MADDLIPAIIGASSGIVGVAVGAGIVWLKEWRSERAAGTKQARYLAVQVVCVLDKFAEACLDVIADNGLSQGQRNPEGNLEAQVKAPESIVYPSDVDWRSIDPDLMYRLLSFSMDLADSWRSIDSVWEAYGPSGDEKLLEERAYQFSILGKMAVDMASKLRASYGIPSRARSNLSDLFKTQKQRIEKEREDARNATPQLPWPIGVPPLVT